MRRRTTLQQISRMKQQQILSLRFCELAIDVKSSRIQKHVDRLYQELDGSGLKGFRPKVYFGDEWFCPDGSTLISVPFFLAHRKLRQLEEKHRGKAEGCSPREMMKLLRHEAGHCVSHALQLNRRREWRRLFGSPKKPYQVENYVVDASSRKFVRHLSGHYAQSHPDEDFAETFAVWLRGGWQKKYRSWPVALRKLEYVDRLMKRYDRRLSQLPASRPLSDVKRLRSTIGRHYARRA